jgi:hypothetical protein
VTVSLDSSGVVVDVEGLKLIGWLMIGIQVSTVNTQADQSEVHNRYQVQFAQYTALNDHEHKRALADQRSVADSSCGNTIPQLTEQRIPCPSSVQIELRVIALF